MKSVISLDEFRKNLSDVVARVMYGNEIVRIQKHNRAGVIVMSEKEYESLRDPRQRFSSKEDWDRLFNLTDKVRDRMSDQDQAELDKIIAGEIKLIRSQTDNDQNE